MADKPDSIDFYLLPDGGITKLAGQLVEKSNAAGKKAVIYCDAAQAEAQSTHLWCMHDLSFYAHGTDDEEGAEFATIWLSTKSDKNQIQAEYAICTSWQNLPDPNNFERLFFVFEGTDEAAMTAARDKWRTWSDAYQGKCRYFAKTEQGGWQQKR